MVFWDIEYVTHESKTESHRYQPDYKSNQTSARIFAKIEGYINYF